MKIKDVMLIMLGLMAFFPLAATAQVAWKPAPGPLTTPWTDQVTPDNVLPEYPRPQLARGDASWKNLNGLWDYAIRPRAEAVPADFEGRILVPFAIESSLSGVGKNVGLDNRLWYQRSFTLPADWAGQRVLLHFGAVDWEATVWVNGTPVGTHQGGYDAFTFDITGALADGPQVITVAVWDPTDQGYQATGKQVNNPKGIWYTPVTGIWQTVWLEAVPETYIESLKITPDIDNGEVIVQVNAVGDGPAMASVAIGGNRGVLIPVGKATPIQVANPRLWSPDDPYLYDLSVSYGKDAVQSYFGMRKIDKMKDAKGIWRMALNNEILFQYGPLDQGWWPDGLYTAPTDAALAFDIQKTKDFGFNMIRKHVKVEPARWYYHCDKLGILVWQDMPSVHPNYLKSGSPSDREPKSEDNASPVAQHARQFELEWQREIDTHYNSPCIVVWVPFNEGWGQYDTVRIANWTKQYDPSRLVICASGWTDYEVGDIMDVHSYPGPLKGKALENRVYVQGEFGGIGLAVPGHLWKNVDANWGYGGAKKDRAELQMHYEREVGKLRDAIAEGTAAGVYTQTTDVEVEVNGLMTYDRKVIKFDEAWLRAFNETLYDVK
jgi:beta-galactosidase/beta-glucuronidase